MTFNDDFGVFCALCSNATIKLDDKMLNFNSFIFNILYKQSNDDFGVFIKRVSYLKIVSLTK